MPQKAATQKMGEYSLIPKFQGYHAREDPTTLPLGTLVSPSQNVLINTSGRVALVAGYVLDGVGSTVQDSGILSNFDFTNFKGDVRNMRAGFMTAAGNDGKLQYRYVDASGTVNWVTLASSLTNIRLSYTSYWDNTALLKLVLWVDGSNNIFEWNGAVTTFASATNATGIIQQISTTPTSGGSGYAIGDILNVSGGTGGQITVGSLTTNSINTVVVTGGGSGYAPGSIITFTGGTGATATVLTVDGGGAILTIQMNSSGTGYTAGSQNPTGGTSGSGATVTLTVTSTGALSVTLTADGSGYSNTATPSATTASTGTGTGVAIQIQLLTANTITLQGTKTWAQNGFYQSRNKSIVINGVTYTYIGGTNTTTLTGISPDPTIPAYPVGTIINQAPITTALSSMTAILSTFGPTVIGCGRRNQIYVGSSNSNSLYISKVNNYQDYSFTTPVRIVGEGDLIPLDAPPVKFIPQEVDNASDLAYDLYISQGLDTWSVIRATLSTDLTKETLELIRLKVSPLQGVKSERLATKMKNEIMFIGNDNVANFLGLMSYQNVPALVDFSYPIINDMNSYDFTDGSIFYYKNYALVAIPKAGLIRIYNMTDQTGQYTSFTRDMEDVTKQPWFWESPITYPISGFYVTGDGTLCGHSYTTSESYTLFSGGSLNGQEIDANATFSFDDKQDRTQSKASDEIFVEGYIQQNTELTTVVGGDIDTAATTQTSVIVGSDNAIVAFGSGAHSLGKNNLGSQPLGGAQLNDSTLPAWFHVFKTYNETPFYLEQISFSSKGVDLAWELITFGTNARFTSEGNNDITE